MTDKPTPTPTPTTTTTTTTLPVAGVWRRLVEEDPLGCPATAADTTTLVLWTQSATSGLYVDLRLPLESPGRSVGAARAAGFVVRPSALAAASTSGNDEGGPEAIAAHFTVVARQKSFAGQLEYRPGDATESGLALQQDAVLQGHVERLNKKRNDTSDDVSNAASPCVPLCTCHWHRHLDYQPPTGGQDIGVCAGAAPPAVDPSTAKVAKSSPCLVMRETGDDASYAEDWERHPDTTVGPYMALELIQEDTCQHSSSGGTCHNTTISRKGYWVRAGNQFAYAVGRPTTTTTATSSNDTARGTTLAVAHKIQDCVGQSLEEAVQTVLGRHADGDDKTDNVPQQQQQQQQQQWDLMMSYVGVTGRVVVKDNNNNNNNNDDNNDDNNDKKEAWLIEQSTNPELVGCRLWEEQPGKEEPSNNNNKEEDDAPCCSQLKSLLLDSYSNSGQLVEQTIPIGDHSFVKRVWKVHEMTGCSLLPVAS